MQDSTRFGLMIKERRKVIAQRDEVLGQLSMIKSIDDNRFIWPHIMDEVSRALPPYTWLTSMAQTSAVPAPPGSEPAAPPPGVVPGAAHRHQRDRRLRRRRRRPIARPRRDSRSD